MTDTGYKNLKVRIIPATTGMLTEIAALEKACFSLPLPESGLQQILADPQTRFLAAVDPQTCHVQGYIFWQQVLDFADLANLAVRDSARGRGLGTALLQAMVAACRADGLAVIRLEVRVSNRIARQLYERNGFIEVGRRPGYYLDTGEAAILMDLPLDHSS
jgi:ribosomal-protein-alanine N-acetyltransferase